MNYLITESQVGKLSLTYLNNTYGLEEVRVENHPNIIFFVREGNIYMEYDIENGDVYISNRLTHAIRRSLDNLFGLDMYDSRKQYDEWIKQYINSDINHLYNSEALPYPIKDVLEQ